MGRKKERMRRKGSGQKIPQSDSGLQISSDGFVLIDWILSFLFFLSIFCFLSESSVLDPNWKEKKGD